MPGRSGDDADYRTLIEHWNGISWRHVPSPNPGGSTSSDVLLGVAASSATNMWTVGQYATPSRLGRNIALHCC